MRIVQIATDPEHAARLLAELGLGARAPPTARRLPRAHLRQLPLPFAG